MGRPYRTALGGHVYHVLNRGNGRLRIFHKDGDYEAFERILGEALEHVPGMRLLAYCLLPNHWHPRRLAAPRRCAFRLWPLADADPYAALARALSRRGRRSSVPRPLQVL